jgi:hypothetical protein
MLIGLRTTGNSLPQSVFILLVWMKSHPLGFVEILLASENRASSPGMRWPSLCKPILIAHAWLRGEHPLRVVQFPGAARTQGGSKFLEPFGLVCLGGEPNGTKLKVMADPLRPATLGICRSGQRFQNHRLRCAVP